MTRVLVVWEDLYFRELDHFVRSRLATHARPDATAYPQVLSDTAHGDGNFARFVEKTWPNVRGKGVNRSVGPIDHLVCVTDGDRLSERLPDVAKPRPDPSDVLSWHASAEATWQVHLRSLAASTAAPASTVHGMVLRWSKESLVLAGYNSGAAKDLLGIDASSAEGLATLAACDPHPASVEPKAFTDTFRRPLKCLSDLAPRRRLKNSPEVDDALRALAATASQRDVVCARVPDIDRIADRIWQLAAG